ncbi:hypothetical protein ABW20_dc0100275 [Dactylellina cionopaga]|nr:hypothetical protein ABW20_dc0100275 [Dactylellina cionopaga]
MSADVTKAPATGAAEGSTSKHRRTSSSVPGVLSSTELEEQQIILKPVKDAAKIGWKINTASSAAPDPDILKKVLTQPPVKKVDLQFPTGITITARNMKGVTFKDAFDAIHKQFKKRADDELDQPYLDGFRYDEKDVGKGILLVLLSNQGVASGGSKKKNKKDADS